MSTSDLARQTDDQLFSGHAGEEPGSQIAYWRDLEMRRRIFALDKATSAAQIEAANAQKKASDATVSMALWTMISAIAVAATVIFTAIGVWLDAFPR